MASIRIHPKLGINPRMCTCPICGKDTDQIVMLGIRNFVDTCDSCGMRHYGGCEKPGVCNRCGGIATRRQLEEGEKIEGTHKCDDCQSLFQKMDEVVDAGGVYWKCACGAVGALTKENPLVAEIREAAGILTGRMGISVKQCPVCGKEGESTAKQ